MAYIYYKNDTKEIVSISNALKENGLSFVEVEYELIEDFIKGTRNFALYALDDNLNIVEKAPSVPAFDTKNKIYKIQSLENADIIVTYAKDWNFRFSNHYQQKIQDNKLKINPFLHFSITEKNNPNKLVRYLQIDSSQLMDDGYSIEFKYRIENSIDKVSIWALHKPYSSATLEIK